jgi:hypothetical protein
MPLYPLSHFPTLQHSGVYGTDFVSVRFGSTRNGTGSVHVYRPLSGPPHMLSEAKGQPGIVVKCFYLSGCVLAMKLEVRNCII